MKKFFLTVVNGYLGLLFPLIVSIILLEKFHKMIYPAVLFIENKLHITRMVGVLGVVLISAALMILLGYLCGLLIKSSFVKKSINKLEDNVLSKIPMYNLVKQIFSTEVGIKNGNNFLPALLIDGNSYSLCYVTNESQSFYTVYVSEGGLSGGEIRIVPKNTIKLLNIGLAEFTRLIKQYGINSAYIVEKLIEPAVKEESTTDN